VFDLIRRALNLNAGCVQSCFTILSCIHAGHYSTKYRQYHAFLRIAAATTKMTLKCISVCKNAIDWHALKMAGKKVDMALAPKPGVQRKLLLVDLELLAPPQASSAVSVVRLKRHWWAETMHAGAQQTSSFEKGR
jgi:hypothetical protein